MTGVLRGAYNATRSPVQCVDACKSGPGVTQQVEASTAGREMKMLKAARVMRSSCVIHDSQLSASTCPHTAHLSTLSVWHTRVAAQCAGGFMAGVQYKMVNGLRPQSSMDVALHVLHAGMHSTL